MATTIVTFSVDVDYNDNVEFGIIWRIQNLYVCYKL